MTQKGFTLIELDHGRDYWNIGRSSDTAVFSATDAHSNLQGGEMTLTAVDSGGAIGFSYSSTGSSDITAYLSSSCAGVTGDPVVSERPGANA